jgi:hypothetical protein
MGLYAVKVIEVMIILALLYWAYWKEFKSGMRMVVKEEPDVFDSDDWYGI